jgi:heme-degrading monooxygenase HmoA
VATISKDSNFATLINVFTVIPSTQQRFVDGWVNFLETFMRFQPSFVSANLHKSLDGARVVNYAQWMSKEAYEAATRNPQQMKPEVKEQWQVIQTLVQAADIKLYEVAFMAGQLREISQNNGVTTLINVFSVTPDQQQSFLEKLKVGDLLMREQPGYISTNFHLSLDGTRITNYAQWESQKAFEAALDKQKSGSNTKPFQEVAAHADPHLYEIVWGANS